MARQDGAGLRLVVDPRSPIEAWPTVGEAAGWIAENPEAVHGWGEIRGTVRTLGDEPVRGELALGLVCGAHCDHERRAVGHHRLDRLDVKNQRDTLREWWGI